MEFVVFWVLVGMAFGILLTDWAYKQEVR